MLFSVLSLLVTSMVVAENESMLSTCASLSLPIAELTDSPITLTLSTRDDGTATSRFHNAVEAPFNRYVGTSEIGP